MSTTQTEGLDGLVTDGMWQTYRNARAARRGARRHAAMVGHLSAPPRLSPWHTMRLVAFSRRVALK